MTHWGEFARWAQWHAAHTSYLDSRYHLGEEYDDLYNRVCSIAIGMLGGRAVVVTGCGDGGVRVIDLLDGTRKSEFTLEREEKKHAAVGVAITQLQGNPMVLAGYEDGTLRLIDMTDGRLIREWHFYSHS